MSDLLLGTAMPAGRKKRVRAASGAIVAGAMLAGLVAGVVSPAGARVPVVTSKSTLPAAVTSPGLDLSVAPSSTIGGTGQTASITPTSTVPVGFIENVVATVPGGPTSMAFTPDGRLLVTQDSGQLRIVQNDVLLPTPAIDLTGRICAIGERGLGNVIVDPEFATNHYVYLYWTFDALASTTPCLLNASTPVNRVSRYVLGDNNLLSPASEKVLIDNIPSPFKQHNGGGMGIGVDGLLYVSVGDGACKIGDPNSCGGLNSNARRLDIPNGKVLRVDRDGVAPASNPWYAANGARSCTDPAGVSPGSGPCQEIFATGMRNPFRLVMKPGTNEPWVDDVGQDTWEEINTIQAGLDYGWNLREGKCALASMTDCTPDPRFADPTYAYDHLGVCGAVTGAAFLPNGMWGAPYDDSYMWGDFKCGRIFRLAKQADGTYTRVPFASGVNAIVSMQIGPNPAGGLALYYLDYVTGQVRRIAKSTATNNPPVASVWARPNGLPVQFNGSASYDPDGGDRVATYYWDFGNGVTTTTTIPKLTYSYPVAGRFRALLRVEDTHGLQSAPVGIWVNAGQYAPTVTLVSPNPNNGTYGVGDSVTMTVNATDVEDGTLPPSSISWTVLLHHMDHTHPFLGPVTGTSFTLSYPNPENVIAAATSYLDVIVTVKDSTGLTKKLAFKLLPAKIMATLNSSPDGAAVNIEASPFTAPTTFTSWRGYQVLIDAPTTQTINSALLSFSSWSDGGAAQHLWTTPSADTTLTVTYTAPRR